MIGKAFCEGAGGEYVESRFLLGGEASFYGVSKFTLPVWTACLDQSRPFYYLDNGYFRPGHFDGFYRVTRNRPQHDGSGRAKPDRWQSLGLELAPWRKTGRHVLVIAQSRTFFDLRGERAGTWLWEALAEVSRATDRQIIVRPKPRATCPKRDLQEDLRDAWCVVTRCSNVAVEAVLQGIPAFVTHDCAAKAMSGTDLSRIESPVYPEREQWAFNLAANQWTLAEMRDGSCWRALQEQK